jgi:hypothetical protein
MFDPKKAALLILAKGKGEDSPEESGPSGMEAFSAMMDAFQKGDKQTAYDAFRAAVESCGSEDGGGMESDD